MSPFKVILTKQSEWRDTQEQWSNGYHFVGDAPADRAEAYDFFEALWGIEANLFVGATLVKAYFYENPDGNVTIGRDYLAEGISNKLSTGGALATTGSKLSLEQASLGKWRCGYTSKGKPRYVMKFYHGIYASSADADKVAWSATAGAQDYAAKFTDGTLPGGAKLCRPDGQVCEPMLRSPWVTTRTLKRRGKRPSR